MEKVYYKYYLYLHSIGFIKTSLNNNLYQVGIEIEDNSYEEV